MLPTKTINHESHESIINDAPRTFSDGDFPVGTVSHQGDLIFVRILRLPVNAKSRKNRQLVSGNTQGSRHVLKCGNAFDCDTKLVADSIATVCPNANIGTDYIGPVFCTNKGKASVIHPEHGNQHFVGDMTIACIYQRNLDNEERERRSLD